MEHSLLDFSFIGIEQINNNNENNTIDKRLLTRETYWSAQLYILKPYELNKRCEFRSKNRINYYELVFNYSIFSLNYMLQ